MAEREGFEPPCRLPGKTLSRRPRYDHFGTSPFITTLGGAPFRSPPRCALAVAYGDYPPALACGRGRRLRSGSAVATILSLPTAGVCRGRSAEWLRGTRPRAHRRWQSA